MYNYFMLIGYVVNDVELKEVGEGKRVVQLRIAVKREFQNMNGEYDTDFINVTLWDFLAENSADFLKKGSRVGIKGRICPTKKTYGDVSYTTNELYADRVVFCGDNGSTKEFEQKQKNTTAES